MNREVLVLSTDGVRENASDALTPEHPTILYLLKAPLSPAARVRSVHSCSTIASFCGSHKGSTHTTHHIDGIRSLRFDP